MTKYFKSAVLSLATALCIAVVTTGPIHAQEATPEAIQLEIVQLEERVDILEARVQNLEARAGRLEARANNTRNQRRARRLQREANALYDRASDIAARILRIQNRIGNLEQPETDPEQVPETDPPTEPVSIEGISIGDLFLSPEAQAILDSNPNAEADINARLVLIATNGDRTSPIIDRPNLDLRWRNNGDGNLVRFRANGEQQFVFEQVRSANQYIGVIQDFLAFFLVRGNVTFADYNAVRDEFLPITRNAVTLLVENVNANSPGLPPVDLPTR